jgi:hypothetical protein
MLVIKSQRAQKLLEHPVAVKKELDSKMRKYPNEFLKVWVDMEFDLNRVKKLSFFGELDFDEKIILESLACLMLDKPLAHLDAISLRECEAFLRDRNSELAFEGASPDLENKFKRFFSWLKNWSMITHGEHYSFRSEKGPFHQLKLVDKIKELKAFLNSIDIINLYQSSVRPELIDVEDLTVYIQVPYQSEMDKSLFEELHILGVEAFQEENLNFIPEA